MQNHTFRFDRRVLLAAVALAVSEGCSSTTADTTTDGGADGTGSPGLESCALRADCGEGGDAKASSSSLPEDSGDDAPVDASPDASCPGTPIYCGFSCDQETPTVCRDGQWSCEAGYPVGCECYDPLTMGLPVCCDAVDGGAPTRAGCSVPDGGQGRIGSGTLVCPGGGTPHVSDAGCQ
jgi:hypothetical protein